MLRNQLIDICDILRVLTCHKQPCLGWHGHSRLYDLALRPRVFLFHISTIIVWKVHDNAHRYGRSLTTGSVGNEKKKANVCKRRSFIVENIHISERKPRAKVRVRSQTLIRDTELFPRRRHFPFLRGPYPRQFPLYQIPLLRHAPEELAVRNSALAAFRGRLGSGSPSFARAKRTRTFPLRSILAYGGGDSEAHVWFSAALLFLFSVYGCWYC